MVKENSIIIVEGAKGVGKTTVVNWLREKMLYTNLYRLSGHNDNTRTGLAKSSMMYDGLMRYVDALYGCGMNLIFDRIFISEYVYCLLGYRNYDFASKLDDYMKSLDTGNYDVYVLNLKLKNPDTYRDRLNRNGKPDHLGISQDVARSWTEQCMYTIVMDTLRYKYHNITFIDVDTSEDWQKQLGELLISIDNETIYSG